VSKEEMPAIPKNSFRKPIVVVVRNTFGVGLRSDLKLDGKWIEGWKTWIRLWLPLKGYPFEPSGVLFAIFLNVYPDGRQTDLDLI
jgi:hypothetical protein